MLRRVRVYLTGFAIGLVLVYFMFGRDDSRDLDIWTPEQRILEDIRLDSIFMNSEKLALTHVLNYPNPFTNSTVFHFDHNRAGDNLEVMLQIFTVTGKLVKTFTSFEPNAKTHISDFHWDGKDDFGDKIGKGVYIYKLTVRSPLLNKKVEKIEKLVIL